MAAMVWRLGCDRGGGQSHLLGFKTVHFVMRQMIFALIIIAVLAAIGVLTLARRVVHQRDHAHRLAIDQFFKQRQRGVMRQLAAQVQAVFGAVETALLRLLHGIDHLLQILKTIAAIAHVANRHGVQHGGDAAGDHHGVMAAHRRVGRPVYLRPRGKELVEVIGMQLDKARQQPAAFPIQRLRRRLWLSAKARMRPSWTSSEPWTTSSSRTSFTLLIIMLSFP